MLLCSYEVVPGPTGASRRVGEYLRALQERYSVVVLCAKTPDHAHIEKLHGARVLRVPVGTGDLTSRLQTYERAVRRQLESEEYAIAHFFEPAAGHALCELRGEHGARLVYEAQGFPSLELPARHPGVEVDARLVSGLRDQELHCLRRVDRVIVGSELTRRYVLGLGVDETAVRVLRAPVPVLPSPATSVEAPLSAPLEILYLGSQVAWQGLTCLLNAVALASTQAPVHLRLVGPRHPVYAPSLEVLTAELGLQERVEWVGPVSPEQLPAVLARADVGVAPLEDVERNRVQGGALAKLSDYLAAGKPVIASDLPLTRAQLPEGAALLHPPGDARALAAHLVTLARSPSLRRRLGAEARAFAARTLDSARVGAELLALYDGLLSPAAARPRPPGLRASAPHPPMHERETDPASTVRALSAAEQPTDPARPVAPRIAAPPPLPPRVPSRVGIPAIPAPPAARPPATPAPQRAEISRAAVSAPAKGSTHGLEPAEELTEDVEEAEEILEADALDEPTLSPWFAQAAHGYCPPEGARFTRHTPPTNFPGREEETDPARAAPRTPAPSLPRTKPR
ncbi:glycosyltransferase family 4 protein [Aggregicoccus sp. 17bor-14]|uniref:glycosyltransferase family 4 protein n=1 Tax=Myxococcaceae TaxID=31 RepID=UPI00351A579D